MGGAKNNPVPGDVFWGNADDQGRDGRGNDGDDINEGNKPGRGNGNDPSEIEISRKLLGEIIASEIELPNLRPKPGLSEKQDTEYEGSRRGNRGLHRWTKTAQKAVFFQAGRELMEGRDPFEKDVVELMLEGLKVLPRSQYVVAEVEPIPSPEMNAVVVFWMDMTGSMRGEPIKMAKEFMFYLKALLSAKYKNITFRYVGFSDYAKKFDTEEAFFKEFLDGGTDYRTGTHMTQQILDEYPSAQFDKFTFGIGDAEDSIGAQSVLALSEMVKQTEYSAFVRTVLERMYPNQDFLAGMKRLQDEQKGYFGYAELSSIDHGLDAIRALLGKGNKSELKPR